MTHRTSRAPQTLFALARTLLWQITTIFGPPVAIAGLEYRLRADHRVIAAWVLALERLVRAILIGAALRLNLAPPAPRPRPQTKTPRRRGFVLWRPEQPATWPVRFRLFAPARSGQRRLWRHGHEPKRFVPTLALAFRLEAAAAVLRDTRTYIRRAAHALARLKSSTANEPRDLHRHINPPPPRLPRLVALTFRPRLDAALDFMEPPLDAFLEAT